MCVGGVPAITTCAQINIASLSQPAQVMLYASYYSQSGIQYTLGRVPIAGCDFSTEVWPLFSLFLFCALSNRLV